MRVDLIVLFQPDIDGSLGAPSGKKPLGIEDLICKRSVEALVVAVLPRAVRIDLHRGDAISPKPFLESQGGELRTVV